MLQHLRNRILFLYTSGRKERIEKAIEGEAPLEFLYGYTHFKENGKNVDYMETNYLRPPKLSLEYWRLRNLNKAFARDVGIGSRSHFFVNQIQNLNRYDVFIATTDSIALGLAHHKKKGRLKGEIIYLNMGLAGVLDKLKQVNNEAYQERKENCGVLLGHCRKVVSLGKGEHGFFDTQYPELEDKFVFIPFGIDTDFWRPSGISARNAEPYILFVGNDLNRDFELLLNIASNCSDMRFKFVTSRLSPSVCPRNVELISGKWQSAILSDQGLRSLYGRCMMVIIPLKESLQPSGQSVALQAMACGKPVVITKTRGFWDLSEFEDNKHLVFCELNNLEEWVRKISSLIEDDEFRSLLWSESRKLVKEKYNSRNFSEKLAKMSFLT
jgi:glycosyltransferase involved in cell wall biosynthesis